MRWKKGGRNKNKNKNSDGKVFKTTHIYSEATTIAAQSQFNTGSEVRQGMKGKFAHSPWGAFLWKRLSAERLHCCTDAVPARSESGGPRNIMLAPSPSLRRTVILTKFLRYAHPTMCGSHARTQSAGVQLAQAHAQKQLPSVWSAFQCICTPTSTPPLSTSGCFLLHEAIYTLQKRHGWG